MKTVLFICALFLPIAFLAGAADSEKLAGKTMSSVAEIEALNFDEANLHPPVSMEAVVAYYKPGVHPDLVVEDSAGGGIYVKLSSDSPTFVRGQRVRIIGHTSGDQFAPVIEADAVQVVGMAEIPPPPRFGPATLADLRDAQRIEIDGVISSAVEEGVLDPPRLLFDLRTRAGVLRLWMLHYAPGDETRFIDAEVRVRGVMRIFGNWRNEPVARRLLVENTADLEVTQPSEPDPFALPIEPLEKIMRYAPDGPPRHRIHVVGTVTYARGEEVYLAQQVWGVRVLSKQAASLRLGDRVEAVGFVTMGNDFARLEDAQFRVLGREMPTPRVFDDADLRKANVALHSGALVRLRADVLEVLTGDLGMKLISRSAGRTFEATLDANPDVPGLRAGSEILLTGIWQPVPESSDPIIQKDPTDFRIIIRAPDDIVVTRPGPWWTQRRLELLLSGVLAVLVIGLPWALFLRQQNTAMKREIAARQSAQNELAKAHTALEAANVDLECRVEERSTRLAREIEARRESEVRFAAITAERNRLARDLHDSVEQMLTGAGVQIDLLRETLSPDQGASFRRLDLASEMLREAKAEARRSIWDLQPHVLEDHDLREALEAMARQLTDGAGIQCQVRALGDPPDLAIAVESQLLRIGQEAITNAVKHAAPEHIRVQLAYGEVEIRLTITDDGHGFEPNHCKSLKDGHFGLTGMRERALRMEGKMEVESAVGQGTAITVTVPLSNSLANAFRE